MAGMATLLGSLLYAGATCQSFDVFFLVGLEFLFYFLSSREAKSFSNSFCFCLLFQTIFPRKTRSGGKTKRRKKTSQNTHETMQIYGKFEEFPLFTSALFEFGVYYIMTPCLGQLCPKEEELLPVAAFRWSPSRLEGGGGSGVLEELPLQATGASN